MLAQCEHVLKWHAHTCTSGHDGARAAQPSPGTKDWLTPQTCEISKRIEVEISQSKIVATANRRLSRRVCDYATNSHQSPLAAPQNACIPRLDVRDLLEGAAHPRIPAHQTQKRESAVTADVDPLLPEFLLSDLPIPDHGAPILNNGVLSPADPLLPEVSLSDLPIPDHGAWIRNNGVSSPTDPQLPVRICSTC